MALADEALGSSPPWLRSVTPPPRPPTSWPAASGCVPRPSTGWDGSPTPPSPGDRSSPPPPWPGRGGPRARRALALARSGRPREALAEADALDQAPSPPAGIALDLARVYAIVSGASGPSPREGRAWADRAMEWLRIAGRADRATRNDPAFDPLRSRADFRLWMSDTAFPDDPFAHRPGEIDARDRAAPDR